MAKRLTADQVKYAEQLLVVEDFEPTIEDAEVRFVAEDGTIADISDVDWTPGLTGRVSVVPALVPIYSKQLTAAERRKLKESAEELQELLDDNEEDEETLDQWREELFQAETQLSTGEELQLFQTEDLRGAFAWLPLASGDEYSEMIVMDVNEVRKTAELWSLDV